MTPYNKNQKLADLLNDNPQLILLLPRFNIALGFGDKRVKEICTENHIDTNFFILLCNVYTFDEYIPDAEEIKAIDGGQLVKFLKASHEYYLVQRLSHIGKHLEKIADEAGNIRTILLKFFSDYKNDVKRHFSSEEKHIFPAIEDLSTINSIAISNYIESVDKSHENINNKLSELTNIIIKYLSPDILPQERINVWFDIAQLSGDLNKHAIIEERILIPFIKSFGNQ